MHIYIYIFNFPEDGLAQARMLMLMFLIRYIKINQLIWLDSNKWHSVCW